MQALVHGLFVCCLDTGKVWWTLRGHEGQVPIRLQAAQRIPTHKWVLCCHDTASCGVVVYSKL